MLNRWLLYLLLIPCFVLGQERFPSKPDNYVTDKALILNEAELSALNTKLKSFEDSTSNQIFVYITTSLNYDDMAQLCQDIFHDWHIGQKGKNNGVLIAIFTDNHKFRIHTGYGLEGQLPDLLTKKIQDDYMRPRFKENNYYAGINDGIDQLIYYTRHEFVPEPEVPLQNMWQSWAIGFGFNILFFALYVRNVLRKKQKQLSKKQRKKQGNQEVRKAIYIIIALIIALLPCVGAMILVFMVIYTSNFAGMSSKGTYTSSPSSSYDSSSSLSSSDSSSSSDFGGGGGGDSGGGGSSSDW